MSLDVTKKVKSITYNGAEIPLDDSGSNALLNELRTQLLAAQAELESKEAELTAKEAELTEQQAIEDLLVDTTNLTSYYNNRPLNRVALYAFYSRQALRSIHMTNVPMLGYACCQSCSVLQEAIFEKASLISGASFANCSALTVLVLGASTICNLAAVSALTGTPIASGTGYVYACDELVESYRTATNWSTYAAQIKPISELPEEIRAKLEL